MANTYNKVLLAGTQANYNALQVKDANALYFCTDTGKLYKGTVDFTNSIVSAAAKPASPIEGKIYVFSSTNTVEAYFGGSWHVLSYPMVTTVGASSDNVHVASAKAVYDAITAAVEAVTGGEVVTKSVTAGPSAAQLTVTKGDDSTTTVTVPGVVTKPNWDSAQRILTIPVTGDTAVEVNIGKDIFIDSSKNNAYNPDTKKIELFLNDGTKIEVPAAALIDVYTGGATDGASVTVGSDNVIKASVIVDPVDGNKLQLTSAGLKVDLSDYSTTTQMNAAIKVAKDAADAAQADATAALNNIDIIMSEDKTQVGSIAKAVNDLATGAVATNSANIAANTAAIATLNGEASVTGSVKKTVSDAVAALVAEDGQVGINTAAIATLNGLDSVTGSVKKTVKDAVDALANGAVATNTAAIATLNKGASVTGSVDNKIAAAVTALTGTTGQVGINTAAIETLNGGVDTEGSVDKKVATAVNALANGAVADNTAAIATLNGEASEAGSVKKTVNDAVNALATGAVQANTEEIAAVAAGLGWGSF